MQEPYILLSTGWWNQMFMGSPTIKWRAFQRGILFSACHGKTLNVAIRQLRQIQSCAIVLVSCRKLASPGWKLSSASFDGAPAVQILLWGWGHCWRQLRVAQERAGSWTAGEAELQFTFSTIFSAVKAELTLLRDPCACARKAAELHCCCLQPCTQAWGSCIGNKEIFLFWDDFTHKWMSLSSSHPCSPRCFLLPELCYKPHHLQPAVPALQDGFPQCDFSLLQALYP